MFFSIIMQDVLYHCTHEYGGEKQRLVLVKFPFTFISRTTPSPLAGLDAPIIGAPS